MRGISFNLLLLVSLSVVGCGTRGNRAFTVADSWYWPPPNDLLLAPNLVTLAKSDFASVLDSKQPQALEILSEIAWKQISAEEARELLGKPPELEEGKQLVLLRGLVLNELNGAEISWHDGVVVVHHGCLGRRPLPIKRKALIAKLPDAPQNVYVHCSMAG
jgi:hypothetical protein